MKTKVFAQTKIRLDESKMYMFGNRTDKFIDVHIVNTMPEQMDTFEMVHKIKMIVLTKENTFEISLLQNKWLINSNVSSRYTSAFLNFNTAHRIYVHNTRYKVS